MVFDRGPCDVHRQARSLRRLLTAALAAGMLVACGSGDEVRDDDGVVVSAGSWSVFDLQDGDCLAPEPDLTGEISEIAVVPCEEPHAQEVFATVEHPADAYPGAGAVALWADGACLGELEETLGYGLEDGLYISYLLPTFDGWNQNDDRRVVCVLVAPDAAGMTGSYVAGTATLARTAPALPGADANDPDQAAGGAAAGGDAGAGDVGDGEDG